MKKCIRRMWPMWLLLVLTSALFSGISVVFAMYLSWLLDHAMPEEKELFPQMIWLGIAVLTASLVSYLMCLVFEQFVKNKALYRMRSRLFERIFSQNIWDYQKMSTAEYLSQMTNDIKILEENYITPLMNVIGGIVSILVSLGLILYYAPMVAVVILICVVLLMMVPALLGSVLQKKQKIYSEQSAIFTNRTKDLFSGYEVLASAGCKKEGGQEFAAENKCYMNKRLGADGWAAANRAISQILGLGVQSAVMITCIWYIMQGKMSVGILMMMVQIMNLFIYPLTGVIGAIPQMKGTAPVWAKLDAYVAEDAEKENLQFEKSVSLRNLSFSYDEKETILEDINLNLEKGKKYVIVGPSGCGKSTLLKVISGYFENYEGSIWIDGKELNPGRVGKLFSLCAFIHQNIFLFDKTIKENICLYKEDETVKMTEVLKRSGVAKFAGENSLLEQEVGENGLHLSGGQKQRIAIARAFYQSKPIILLDEGTSALDMQTAYEIENDLLRDTSLTLVTVTHHPNEKLMQQYDQIIRMDKGRIIAIE